jgi:transcriptional regulator with XRE-family HTH domain
LATIGFGWTRRKHQEQVILDDVYYLVYSTRMAGFGTFVRDRREALRGGDPTFSVRQVAARIGVQPSYLSKVEREEVAPPSEATIRRLARVLDVDTDVLLALAGKVSGDLMEAIRRRPVLFAELIRQVREMPDHAVLRLVREVRDGEW